MKWLGKGTIEAYNIVRKQVSKVEYDRCMYLDINTCEDIVKSNVIVEKVEEKIGSLL